MGFALLIFLAFCVVLLCVFAFLVPCCDVHYDFRIQTMFGSSLPPFACRKAHVLFTLFVCTRIHVMSRYLSLFTHNGVQHILCWVFVCLCLVSGVHSVASFPGLSSFYCPFSNVDLYVVVDIQLPMFPWKLY